MEKTFLCPIPWVSLCFGPKSTLRACCHQNGDMEKNSSDSYSVDDIIQLKHNEKLRKQMLNNVIPKECMTCFDTESAGGFSPRQEYLARFKFTPESANKVTYLDLTVDNNCNLECAMCSSYYSYKLNDFYSKKLNIPSIGKWEIKFSNENIQSLLPDLLMLTITGGEPFLSKRALEILHMVADSGEAHHIGLRLFTNLTLVPKNLEEIFNKFQSVELLLSIDSVEENYEFIRHPGKWKTLEENIRKLRSFDLKNTTIKLHSVISAFNWGHLAKLIKFYSGLNLGNKNILPVFIEIENQPYLHPSVLPRGDFNKGLENIEIALNELVILDPQFHYEIHHFRSLLKKISSEDSKKYYIDYITYIEKIKQSRASNN